MPPGSGSAAPLSLLDRLLDPKGRSHRLASAGTVQQLKASLRRDVEALLNARRPWWSIPAQYSALRSSTLSYGMADFAGGIINDSAEQERLRAEIEATITRFEPRLATVEVELLTEPSPLEGMLAFRIRAFLLVDPVVEPIAFDTVLDTATSDVDLHECEES